MLALTTTDALTLIDAPTLKNAPSSVSSCQTLLSNPVASSWPSDSNSLFIASSSSIHQYDLSSNSLHQIYSAKPTDSIHHLVSKDNGNAHIFSVSNSVYVLEGSSGRITQTFESHKSPITSLALSNDCTLLATTSSGAAHVHNLANGSHTVLRGLPPANVKINTCLFHTHSRTRLLLSAGRQMLVYDTTRPSGPMKIIAMADGIPGAIDFIACSPFSKTLAAFATTGGNVCLVDLEKEKAIFRTINTRVPLTCLAFSPEGSRLYLGTGNGKLLVLDLRSVDKPPKAIVISDIGDKVENICVQKKKSATEVNMKAIAATTAKPVTQAEPIRRPVANTTTKPTAAKAVNKPILRPASGRSPTRPRSQVGSSAATPDESPTSPNTNAYECPSSQPSSKSSTSPRTRVESKRGVLLPTKDPLGNINMTRGRSPVKDKRQNGLGLPPPEPPSPSLKLSAVSTRRLPLGVPSTRTRNRAASTSTNSNETTSPLSTVPVHRAGVSRRGASTSPKEMSNFPPSLPAADSGHQVTRKGPSSSAGNSAHSRKQTNGRRGSCSSDLSDPATPPAKKKKAALSMLGLGIPGADRWQDGVNGGHEGMGKAAGKSVGLMDDNQRRDGMENPRTRADKPKGKARERESQMKPSQFLPSSPPRPGPTSWAPSPVLQSTSGNPNPHAPSSSDLLTTIRDVMFDFQRETRADMMGLHLDLVRMGRGWRQELRTLMNEHVGDLKELREENAKLREENTRLRGFRV